MLRALARSIYWAARNTHMAVTVGRGSRFDSSVRWRVATPPHIGRGTYVGAETVITSATGSTLSIGERVWIGGNCELSAGGRLRIGDDTSLQHRGQLHGDVDLGAGCIVAANFYASSAWHEFRRTPPLPIRLQDRAANQRPFRERSRPVSVGDDCWIGIGVAVMPGVRIGRGCVIGANSVVTRDLPPYSIAAGGPARVLGRRLEFAPPRAIVAGEASQLPYFYAGFSLYAPGGTGLQIPLLRGGYVAQAQFALALAAASGDVIELELDALADGNLLHGAASIAVVAGTSTVQLACSPDSDGLLAFHFVNALPTAVPAPLVLRRAVIVAPV